jgi:hypothetical protein
MEVDRRAFFATLGGAAAVAAMSSEAKADALEEYMQDQLNEAAAAPQGGPAPPRKFPTAAQVEAQIETRRFRRGVGSLFTGGNDNVKKLPPLPANPTFMDYWNLRFQGAANHCLQSATRALKTGMSEDVILACLLHDTVQALIRVDHGWWGAQIYEPYVSDKVAYAIRYHQALRFYEDKAAGYEYPDLYRNLFGEDYQPDPYIEQTYKMVRKHKWYDLPRMVTVNDLYAFDPNSKVSMDPFVDILGRHFKAPKEGLGFDNSPVAHMWRSIAMPDHPL